VPLCIFVEFTEKKKLYYSNDEASISCFRVNFCNDFLFISQKSVWG
jgi:hypothetical protein